MCSQKGIRQIPFTDTVAGEADLAGHSDWYLFQVLVNQIYLTIPDRFTNGYRSLDVAIVVIQAIETLDIRALSRAIHVGNLGFALRRSGPWFNS